MRYFYMAPESELRTLYSKGIFAAPNGEIPIIVLPNDFIMDKLLFDLIAWEVKKIDVYCLFQVLQEGMHGEITDGPPGHPFAGTMKILKQKFVQSDFLAPFATDVSYEGMGLEVGVFPVENKEKFTPEFKQKILEYLEALD